MKFSTFANPILSSPVYFMVKKGKIEEKRQANYIKKKENLVEKRENLVKIIKHVVN